MDIFVGKISHGATEEDLQALFEEYGQVDSVKIPTHKYSGRHRGFGFVTMPDRSEAIAAIEAWNGREWMGQLLTVNEARPRQPRRDQGRG